MGALEELTTEECRELLATAQVGRLALGTEAGLRIYPVNFALHGDDIVFRTLPYGQLADNVVDAQVAFSVDDLDRELRSGWHVLAVGVCRRVEATEEMQEVRAEADPDPWAEGQRTLFFRIVCEELTGRRVRTQ